jgi:hypothetical protein
MRCDLMMAWLSRAPQLVGNGSLSLVPAELAHCHALCLGDKVMEADARACYELYLDAETARMRKASVAVVPSSFQAYRCGCYAR